MASDTFFSLKRIDFESATSFVVCFMLGLNFSHPDGFLVFKGLFISICLSFRTFLRFELRRATHFSGLVQLEKNTF